MSTELHQSRMWLRIRIEMNSVAQLVEELTKPSPGLVEELSGTDGDIMLLGVGGKMGPTLAGLAANADRKAGVKRTIYGVSRFSDGTVRDELEAFGVNTIAIDLLDDAALQSLPDVPNVIYMAGRKFGTAGNEHYTWVMNSYLPGRVAEKFKSSRIVVFSTGNVYPFVRAGSGGANETVPPAPVGEYGQSCLGRERVFEHFSHRNGTPLFVFRLNYAIDMRYGVLLEIARAVAARKPVDVAMGSFNCIWQGDANEIALRALARCASPPQIVNVTGTDEVSIREVAKEFGRRFGKEPSFQGTEGPSALLSDASKMVELFGRPRVGLAQMIDWVAEWVSVGGPTWDRPTHFQERSGSF